MVVLVAVGLTESIKGDVRSGQVKSEAKPRRLFACVPPLYEAGMCVSNDFDGGRLYGNDHMPIMMLSG
jgi:hypothetical protein